MNKMNTAILRNGVFIKVKNEEDLDNFVTEISGVPDNHQSTSAEPCWNPHATKIFADECVKRKTELLKPHQRRRMIFNEIRLQMMQKGYDFDEASLDRKFRNLKSRFFFVKNNNSKRWTRPIVWPYYAQMSLIFPENDTRSTQHQSTDTAEIHPSSKVYDELEENGVSNEGISRRSRYSYPNKLEALRCELLAFEERRTLAIEAIVDELKEANKLTRTKLQIEKKRLELSGHVFDDDNVDEEMS